MTEPERRQVFVAYGLSVPPPGDGGAYEVDHLIPLALGGSNDLANLWPEPRPEAEHKDRVEDLFHTLVCAGKMDLDEAQRIMATDWTAARR